MDDEEESIPWQLSKMRQEIIDALEEAVLYTISPDYSRSFTLAQLDKTLSETINANRRSQQVVRRAMRRQREAATSLRQLHAMLGRKEKK